MDIGTDSLPREDLKESTNSPEEDTTKTEPIAITRGRRRPSGKSCADNEKVGANKYDNKNLIMIHNF